MLIPESFVMRDPVAHRAKTFGDEVISAFAAVPLLGHQSRIEQDAKVLRDRRPAHLEMHRDRLDGMVGLSEQVEHVSPRRMADRSEYIGFAIRGFAIVELAMGS